MSCHEEVNDWSLRNQILHDLRYLCPLPKKEHYFYKQKPIKRIENENKILDNS